MAIYHLHAQIIKRSSGRSSVAASAYRAGEKLHNEYDGITHDYTRKSGVVHSEIMLPQNAPKEFQDRSTLWNAVEKSEKRKDSQTAREIDVALPKSFFRLFDHHFLLIYWIKPNKKQAKAMLKLACLGGFLARLKPVSSCLYFFVKSRGPDAAVYERC